MTNQVKKIYTFNFQFPPHYCHDSYLEQEQAVDDYHATQKRKWQFYYFKTLNKDIQIQHKLAKVEKIPQRVPVNWVWDDFDEFNEFHDFGGTTKLLNPEKEVRKLSP